MPCQALNANGWNGATYEIWNASNVGSSVAGLLLVWLWVKTLAPNEPQNSW